MNEIASIATFSIHTLLVLITICLFFWSDWQLKRLRTRRNVLMARRLTELSICGYTIIMVWFFLREIKKPPSNLISWAIVIFIIATTFLVFQGYIRGILFRGLYKPANYLIGNYYLSKHFENIRKDDIPSAKEAVEKACEIDPQNPNVWLARANFLIRWKEKVEEAKEYLETARKLIEQNHNTNHKTLGCYEFCQGKILLREDNLREALIHFKNSQSFEPAKEKLEVIKKIEAELFNSDNRFSA